MSFNPRKNYRLPFMSKIIVKGHCLAYPSNVSPLRFLLNLAFFSRQQIFNITFMPPNH